MTVAVCEWPTPSRLAVKRRYTARRERVWQAWTEPERLRKWFGSPGYTLEEVEMDCRVGGRVRKVFRTDAGERIEVSGEFVEVVDQERLSYTWNVSRPDRDLKNTLVTVDFIEHADGTELRLTHEGLDTDEARESHQRGWITNLDQLAGYAHAEGDAR